MHAFDFHETFYHVIKYVTIFLILTLSITNNWPIKQLNINTDFLNDILDEEVYMEQYTSFVSSNPSLYVSYIRLFMAYNMPLGSGLKGWKACWFNFASKIENGIPLYSPTHSFVLLHTI